MKRQSKILTLALVLLFAGTLGFTPGYGLRKKSPFLSAIPANRGRSKSRNQRGQHHRKGLQWTGGDGRSDDPGEKSGGRR